MKRDALKFIDIDTFLSVMEGMGYNGEITDLLYEQNKLPYGTAYFVPTHLLPPSFDLQAIDQFGGVVTQVEDIRYLGTEEFQQDFMIFPLSLKGYIEVASTFVPESTTNDWATGEMNFIINLEDGGGKEFYLASSGKMLALADDGQDEPQLFKTAKQVAKKVDQLREKYPETCQLYAVEQRDFVARRRLLQHPPTDQ